MLRDFMRRTAVLAVSAAMVLAMMPAAVFAEAESQAGDEAVLTEGTFAPGEAIVVFRAGAVKDQKMSLNAAADLENVDDDFGSTMETAEEETEAARDAKSEIKILRRSLGDDFELIDSIAFSDDLIMSLVRSEKYKTEVLIEKLSENSDVESAEPNWYTKEESTYSLNDICAKYAYQTVSPKDTNEGGDDASTRGADPEKTISTGASSVTDFKNIPAGDEIVVAVNDSGINYDHEDLQDVLWTNPGNIGLDGEHGFNFYDNMTEIKDTLGHGSHVCGIIAANANNGKGVAGVASGVNVKIMMCATNGSQEEQPMGPTLYRRTGAMYYALRAKQRGVNVVAMNNSWGSPGPSYAYDKVIDMMGEAGILNFVAASNDALDIDALNYAPPGGDSPYMVVVGSAQNDGTPSGFSDWGKSNVDLFAPGDSILSTVCYSSYFPNLYTEEERAENTEYYGQFSSETKISSEVVPELGMNEVVPETHGDGVKSFGAAKFFVQDQYFDPEGGEEEFEEDEEEPGAGEEESVPEEEEPVLPDATCEVSIAENRYFTDNFGKDSSAKPASLKITVNNAKVGEKYFIYFPFEKNHATTGYDNTRYSVTMQMQSKEDEFSASMHVGEVIKHDKDGIVYCEAPSGDTVECKPVSDMEFRHLFGASNQDEAGSVLSWDDVDPEKTDVVETGLGFSFTAFKGEDVKTPEEEEFMKGAHPITFYVDAIGISRPATDGKTADEVFSADTSYDLMSGTSMATPAATGAYAVMCALEPKKGSQSEKEYALQNRAKYLSLVTRREVLNDLCSTGGYIDLSNLNNDQSKSAITDAVCDLKNGTLTLKGTGLSGAYKLYKRSLAEDGAEEVLIDEKRIAYAKDGSALIINDASDLFGTYTQFILKDADEVKARGSFFLVKGQNAPELVLSEEHKETIDDTVLAPRYLFTDQKGKDLYAFQICSYSLYGGLTGELFKYDGNKFVEYQGTKITDSISDYYENELDYSRHEVTRGLEITPKIVRQPIIGDDKLYTFVDVSYSPREDAEEEEIENTSYLAVLDFTSSKPSWRFQKIDPISDMLDEIGFMSEDNITYCMFKGRIYAFGADESKTSTFVLALDPSTGKWERLEDYPDAALSSASAYVHDGKVYLLFGKDGTAPDNKGVFTFDGKAWTKDGTIPILGKGPSVDTPDSPAATPVRDGILVFNYSTEGAGNVYLYNTSSHKCEPLYYTICDGISNAAYTPSCESAIETEDGLYYIRYAEDDAVIKRFDLYRIPKSSHVYRPLYKEANPMKVTSKNRTVKAAKLKKKAVTVKAVTVKKAEGKVTYKRGKISCSKKLAKDAKAKIKVNTKNGKITLKKGLKKGKYTVSVTVSAKGNDYYKAGKKTVKVKIKVR